jgi:hypothetical protein
MAEEGSQAIDFDVEDVSWSPLRPPAVAALPCCAFIDGVRRVDSGLFAEEDGSVAPALAGSWGVGVSWSTRPPTIQEVRVGRAIVVGGGLKSDGLETTVGTHRLDYCFVGVAGTGSLDPMVGLQNEMRNHEARLADQICTAAYGELVVQDGPLTYYVGGPIVGLIKRQSRRYLPVDRQSILSALCLAERTPLFRLGEQQLERYSWYSRIAPRRPIDGVLSGIVRLEVMARVGVGAAQAMADLTTAVLPSFSSRSGSDPRAPQNLYPVGQLETVLRHRLGDPHLIRRAIEAELWRQNVPQ